MLNHIRVEKASNKCKDNESTNSQNDNSESTNNDHGITEHQATIYAWSYSGNATSLLIINTIYDKIVFWRKNLFFTRRFR